MKKLVTFILVLAAVLSVSGIALADGAVTLDIADGSIEITATGYKQGSGAEVPHTSDYVITQTGDKTTDKTITINSVATGATVTLQNLNMVYEVNNEKGPVIVNASTTLILDGTNTLKGGFNGGESNTLGALAIGDNAVVTIQGTGILNATGVKRVAGIYVGSNAVLTIADGTINATGGDMAAPGIGASNYMPKTSPAGTIIISGGTVTAKGGKSGGVGYAAAIGGVKQNAETTKRNAAKVQITGGTVNATSGDAQYVDAIFANEMSITGGTVVCDKFPTITGKKLVKLSFYDDDGAALAGKEVTVGSWNAVTDTNGVVYMYIDGSAESVTAKVDGESEARTAHIKDGEALFALPCTCTVGSGTIEWVGSFDDVTLYNGVDSREIAISAKYVAGDGCKAPVHGDFETVTITENSDHAAYADGKLTVSRHTANYEVTLSADANGTNADKTIKVIIESMKALDLMDGAITFDGVKYTQGENEHTPDPAGEQVVVYGSGTTDNYLEVTAGTANVILDNANIKAAALGNYMDASGIIRVTGGELNLTLKGENTLERGRGGLINVGKEGSTNVGDAVLNIMGDNPASLKLISTPKDGSGQASSALIGGYSVNTMAGTINIQGGNIIIPNACGVGIGSPRGSTSGSAEYHYDINISGGSVDINEVNQLCTGIGMGCGTGEDTVVNVNITGGNVDVASTYNSTDAGVAIGASGYTKGDMNIAIGDKNNPSKTDPVVKATTGDNMIAIGAAGGSSVDLKIDIFGGEVTAKSGSLAIGGSISGGETRGIKSCQITISGGDVSAKANGVAIGVHGPAGYPGTETAVNRKIDASIEISGDAKVTATANKMAIGMPEMGANSEMDIEISGTADVEATATGVGVENGAAIAIGTEKGKNADKYNAAPSAGSTTIAITSPNVTLKAAKPIATATKTTLASGTAYTVITDNGTQRVKLPCGGIADIDGVKANSCNPGNTGNTGGSSYSGPSIWYIGGNSFGTSTTQMPTSVEIDYVPVPFTMEGSNIVVSCINPGARWATVKWHSTSATINFNPDANVVCAQVVIPKTGDMPIWATIAEFLGF